eukprot:2181124-Amphidinium_carterae.1
MSCKRKVFNSVCKADASMSFASRPKGFSISTAMKFNVQRMKTWTNAKANAHAGVDTSAGQH